MDIYTLAGVVLLTLVVALWLLSLRLEDSSIMDVFWGAGFVILNGLYFALAPAGGLPERKWLFSLLVTAWGLRLSIHILWRNKGKGEDFRYRKWRLESTAGWWWRSLFKVFLLQGAIMWVLSALLLAVQTGTRTERIGALDYAATALWTIGFLFEAVGDFQLARFRSNPGNRHKVLQSGLWRYSRHPNYFGDAVQWWAFYLMAVAASGSIWTIFSPILMTLMLLRVSGVTLLEKSLRKSKPGYERYTRTTSAFLPWFPKTSVAEDRPESQKTS